MKGQFKVYVNGEETGVGKNQILNTGLSAFSDTVGLRDKCVVGDSRVPPTPTDTGVSTPLLEAIESDEFFYRIDGESYMVNHSKVYTFNVLTDLTFTEIGICDTDVNTFLSRALAPDNNGNPAVIKINAGEELKIVHNMFIDLSDISGSQLQFNYNTVTYTVDILNALTRNQTVWRGIESNITFNTVVLWENFELTGTDGQGTGTGKTFEFTPDSVDNIIAGPNSYEFMIYADTNAFLPSDTIGGMYVRLSGLDSAYQIKISPPIPFEFIKNRGIIIGIDL